MSKHLVSVLIPVFNGENFIGETIGSVLHQTYTELELIIVNDGSTDGTEEIVKSFKDQRIRYYVNESNVGLSCTRNRLIDLSKGDFLAMLDADDVWEKDKLERQMTWMVNHPGCGLCGTWAKTFNSDGVVTGYMQPPVQDAYVRANLLFQSSIVQSSTLIRRSCLGDLRYNGEYRASEDYDFCVRLSSNTKLHNIPSYLVLYRVYGGNMSITRKDQLDQIRRKIISRQLDSIPSIKEEDSSVIDTVGNLEQTEQSASTLAGSLKKLMTTVPQTAIVVYRWIFYCVSTKRYSDIFRVSSFNPLVMAQVLALVTKKVFKKFL